MTSEEKNKRIEELIFGKPLEEHPNTELKEVRMRSETQISAKTLKAITSEELCKEEAYISDSAPTLREFARFGKRYPDSEFVFGGIYCHGLGVGIDNVTIKTTSIKDFTGFVNECHWADEFKADVTEDGVITCHAWWD